MEFKLSEEVRVVEIEVNVKEDVVDDGCECIKEVVSLICVEFVKVSYICGVIYYFNVIQFMD